MIKRAILCLVVVGCSSNNNQSDAYGNFEATEITVSAESTGRLLAFNVEEGARLEAGALVGIIDTSQLAIQKSLLLSSLSAIRQKAGSMDPQISVVEEQIRVAEREKKRIQNLIVADAATTKQLDDISGQIDILGRQLSATRAQKESILAEIGPVLKQVDQVNDLVRKCYIYNPISGTVLTRFVEQDEIITYGRPLYLIADVSTMFLRVYISGSQLPGIKLGEEADLLIDSGRGDSAGMSTLRGVVDWISAKAEFTPKVIQTREERVNLVYAVKIRVTNDGRIKIGMPGEANFKP